MGKNLKKVLGLKLSFVALTIYVNIFINYFFWEKTGDLKMVMFFSLVQWIVWMVPLGIGTITVLKNSRLNYFFSSGSAVLAFLVLGLFSERLSVLPLLVVVAVFTAMITTFFYASNTLALLSSAGSSKEINRFISLEGSLTSLVSFAVPLINGVIIYYFGFSWSFALMTIVSLIYFIFALNSVETEKVEWSLFKKTLKEERFSKEMTLYNIVSIFTSRSMTILGSLLLVVISSNELEISMWNGLSVVVIYILGMVIRKQKGISMVTWSIVCIVLLTLGIAMVVMGLNLTYLIVIHAIVVYLNRLVELSIPLKIIRRKDIVGKVVLNFKREYQIGFSRILIAILCYITYQYFGLEVLFLGIMITSILALMWLIQIRKTLELQLK